jgi:hypothetical protein
LPYTLRVDDPAKARAALEAAQREARQVLLGKHGRDSDEYREADKAVMAAQAKVDACYETVVITALHPADYEAAKAAHPPTPEQLAVGEDEIPPDVNVDTFVPAVLAAGTDAGMSDQDWATFLAEHCSDGERQELRALVLAVNERPRAAEPVVLPKGSTMTRSWPWS